MWHTVKWYFVNLFESFWGVYHAIKGDEIAAMYLDVNSDPPRWVLRFDAGARDEMREG